jgi:DNA-binding PadR family transcriptional regulator
MYPLLSRMEKLGWLKQCSHPKTGIKARKGYELTATGREVLNFLEDQVTELYREVVRKEDY